MAALSNTSRLSFLLLLGIIVIVVTQLTSPSEASSNPFISTHAEVLSATAAKPMERRFVAVQGVVYCKSCKYAGVDTLLGASPLLGAVVKLECNNTNKPLPATRTATTDKNGYFYLEAPRTVTSYAFHKCKASLVSSPVASCSKPSLLHGGSTGSALRPAKPIVTQNSPLALYTVGPFAFEPQCPR